MDINDSMFKIKTDILDEEKEKYLFLNFNFNESTYNEINTDGLIKTGFSYIILSLIILDSYSRFPMATIYNFLHGAECVLKGMIIKLLYEEYYSSKEYEKTLDCRQETKNLWVLNQIKKLQLTGISIGHNVLELFNIYKKKFYLIPADEISLKVLDFDKEENLQNIIKFFSYEEKTIETFKYGLSKDFKESDILKNYAIDKKELKIFMFRFLNHFENVQIFFSK